MAWGPTMPHAARKVAPDQGPLQDTRGAAGHLTAQGAAKVAPGRCVACRKPLPPDDTVTVSGREILGPRGRFNRPPVTWCGPCWRENERACAAFALRDVQRTEAEVKAILARIEAGQ